MHPSVRTHAAKVSKRSIFLALAILLVLAVAAWLLVKAPLAPRTKDLTLQHQSPTTLACAAKLPLSTLVGQVLMVGLTADEMSPQARLFKQYHVGGAVIMTSPANPYDSSIKLFKLDGGNKGDPLLIATDEEGGSVQRFSTLGLLPAPADMAAEYSPSQAEGLIAAHGKKLKSIGVDMVLGPLADVGPTAGTGALGNRVFSSDPNTVAQYDAAYVRAWQAAGLVPVLKHFPGLGSATGNTDYQPATTPPLSSLVVRDFRPYKALASSGVAVMVGNQNVPGWFVGPASLSPAVNAYLRTVLGYKDRLVITDSLTATAVTATTDVSSAVVEAIAAGNDMAIIVSPNVSTATPADNQTLIADAEAALEKAVGDGQISTQRLAEAVNRKLNTQNISACSL